MKEKILLLSGWTLYCLALLGVTESHPVLVLQYFMEVRILWPNLIHWRVTSSMLRNCLENPCKKINICISHYLYNIYIVIRCHKCVIIDSLGSSYLHISKYVCVFWVPASKSSIWIPPLCRTESILVSGMGGIVLLSDSGWYFEQYFLTPMFSDKVALLQWSIYKAIFQYLALTCVEEFHLNFKSQNLYFD